MTSGYTHLPSLYHFNPVIRQLDSSIPNISALLGPVIGLGAARASICHFSVIASSLRCRIHYTNGIIDNLAESESEAFMQIRKFLSYLPSCGTRELPPFHPSDLKSPVLNSLDSRRAQRSFDINTAISEVVSHDTFEIGALWGRTAILGLARLAGYQIGIIASNKMANAGALDAHGCVSVIVRRCYGVAGSFVMREKLWRGRVRSERVCRCREEWRAEIERGEKTLEELTRVYEELGSPVRTATRWGWRRCRYEGNGVGMGEEVYEGWEGKVRGWWAGRVKANFI
ncbi:carboxyl transferase domain-containing protein [Trichophaea hybrida]|nr:carboxyl transferase domain-containing protein [Trichophaea hybrida]